MDTGAAAVSVCSWPWEAGRGERKEPAVLSRPASTGAGGLCSSTGAACQPSTGAEEEMDRDRTRRLCSPMCSSDLRCPRLSG